MKENQGGRPEVYTDEIAAEICFRLGEGESLVSICKDSDMPSRRTVHRWLTDEDKKEFWHNYALSTKLRAERMFEEVLTIADDNEADIASDDDGKTITNYEAINRSRLRVDTRKWILARMDPKKYGDRVAQEISGPDGGKMQVEVSGVDRPRNETRDEWLKANSGVS